MQTYISCRGFVPELPTKISVPESRLGLLSLDSIVSCGKSLVQPASDPRLYKNLVMPWLHVKYNYFKIISAFVDVRLK